ncbi:hypothetical protein G7Y89_g9519 [Cudoniella acicularis]|uniref:Heterokaryon incompatibility domain-containing protein n=1 Tax=Cudoniella acicularis TaxID=354080 RepID=A0A8H4W013_9HELO|nr:hypothetical protein G7Y89_g9519 [Cudoniella acicularis]
MFISNCVVLNLLESPAAVSNDVIGRRIDSSAESETNIRRTLSWLDSCLSGHPDCSVGSYPSRLKSWGTPLPTRVIRIVSSDGNLEINLHEPPATETGSYVALSHCWGLHQIITTTAMTFEDRKKDIPFSALSKTFQEAVRTTVRLGIRYIWIDSLCIIQDSGSDWEYESSKMGLVYQNAILTISASAASDGLKGCFFPRESGGPQPVEILYDKEGQCRKGGVYIQGRVPTLDEDLTQAPLNKRAWTLQERLLSKRILHCCASQLYWECVTTCFSESGLEFPPAYGLPRILEEPKKNKDIIKDFQSPHWRWVRLLAVYSERALTKDFDKLPALSGLASEFAKRTGDEYLAGLWKQFLPVGLLWEVKNKAASRRVPGRAPSWSWASVEGKLGICQTPLRILTYIAEVVEASTTPLGVDKYGQVRDGIIRLRTKVRGELFCGSERSPLYVLKPDVANGFYPIRRSQEDPGVIGYFAPDDTTAPVGSKKTAVLIVESSEKFEKVTVNKYVVLFVEPVEGTSDSYHRIGTGIILSSTKWFEEVADQILTLL